MLKLSTDLYIVDIDLRRSVRTSNCGVLTSVAQAFANAKSNHLIMSMLAM